MLTDMAMIAMKKLGTATKLVLSIVLTVTAAVTSVVCILRIYRIHLFCCVTCHEASMANSRVS